MENEWHSLSKQEANLDINSLVDCYYEIYKNELKNSNSPLMFEGKKVVINTKVFQCKDEFFVGNNKNCNNKLFSCNNCPFYRKDEMFFHIASNRDNNLFKKFKSKYRNKQKSRLPGLFEKHRLAGIKNIKKVIETYQNDKDILYFENNTNKERIIYLWAKKRHFIVVIGYNLWDKKQVDFYLKSAYIVSSDDDEYKFKRLYNKYKKAQKTPSNLGVL